MMWRMNPHEPARTHADPRRAEEPIRQFFFDVPLLDFECAEESTVVKQVLIRVSVMQSTSNQLRGGEYGGEAGARAR